MSNLESFPNNTIPAYDPEYFDPEGLELDQTTFDLLDEARTELLGGEHADPFTYDVYSPHLNAFANQALNRLSAPHTSHITDTKSPNYPAPPDPRAARYNDYDSEVTYRVNHDGAHASFEVAIGEQPHAASSALKLYDDLIRSRNARADETVEQYKSGQPVTKDAWREVQEASYAPVVVANLAERSDETVEGGRNGRNFHLAITDAGTEIYVTPLRFLQDLYESGRIIALYEVPSDNSVYGSDEQFRSGKVGKIREHPGELKPIFQFNSVEELKAARAEAEAAGEPAPDDVLAREMDQDGREGRLILEDKYGNLRFRTTQIGELGELVDYAQGESVDVRFTYPNPDDDGATTVTSQPVPVVVGLDLRTAPDDESLTVYTQSGNDHLDSDSTVGEGDLIARVNNPNDDPDKKNTAAEQLRRLFGEEAFRDLGKIGLRLTIPDTVSQLVEERKQRVSVVR